jgi:hypothetical protein
MKKILMLICIITLVGVVVNTWSFAAGDNNLNDIKRILGFSNQVIEGNKRVVLSYRSSYKQYNTTEELKKMGMEITKSLGLSSNMVHVLDQEPICIVMSQDNDMKIITSLVGSQTKMSYFILSLELDDQISIDFVEDKILSLEQRMRSLGLSANWNITVQGDAKTEGYQELKQMINNEFHTQEIGKYQDHGTTDISLYIPAIYTSIVNAKQSMNLQVRLHLNSETNNWTLTIGMPIIDNVNN